VLINTLVLLFPLDSSNGTAAQKTARSGSRIDSSQALFLPHRASLRAVDSALYFASQQTMIYTHVLNRGGRGVRSSIDR
jgi:hypothetical protein